MYCIKSNYLLILQSRTGTVDKFGLLATTKKNAKTHVCMDVIQMRRNVGKAFA